MKVVSNKVGSARERVDAEAVLLTVANWRIVWEDAGAGMKKAAGRHLVLPSVWGAGERQSELWLTEAEAVAVAKAVVTALFDNAPAPLSPPKGAE